VQLPSTANASAITADYSDGVLTVSVPLTKPQSTALKIEIGRGAASTKAASGS
jgi:HSP20 family molecular chaperone IbpA